MEKKFRANQIAGLPKGVHADGGGLVIKVSEGGTATFGFRWRQVDEFTRESKHCYMGLGSIHRMSLAEAREKATAIKKQIDAGIDPREQRTASKKPKPAPVSQQSVADANHRTFKDVAEEFLAARERPKANKKAEAQWGSTLRHYVYPVMGDRPIADVNVQDIRGVLAPIWRTKAETASRIRQRLEKVINYAIAVECRRADNPAMWARLEPILGTQDVEPKHFAALPYQDLPRLYAALKNEATLSALALRLLLLTACRTNEIIGLQWSEVDFKERVLRIPSERSKTRKEHIVPLSDEAIEVLRQAHRYRLPAPESSMWVLPGERLGRHISNMSALMALKRMGLEVTTHGTTRAGFKTYFTEETDTPAELVEACLGHTLDKVQKAYSRGSLIERRRTVMASWAAYVADPSAEPLLVKKGSKQREPRVANMTKIEELRTKRGLPVTKPGRKPKSLQV